MPNSLTLVSATFSLPQAEIIIFGTGCFALFSLFIFGDANLTLKSPQAEISYFWKVKIFIGSFFLCIMDLENFKEKLKSYRKENIIITPHAEIRALARNIDLEEVKKNISNPEKLVYVEEQEANNPKEKKYGCYFAYSDNYCHKYAVVVNGKLIIVTIISINRRWQNSIRR